jgi:hypothetical protein
MYFPQHNDAFISRRMKSVWLSQREDNVLQKTNTSPCTKRLGQTACFLMSVQILFRKAFVLQLSLGVSLLPTMWVIISHDLGLCGASNGRAWAQVTLRSADVHFRVKLLLGILRSCLPHERTLQVCSRTALALYWCHGTGAGLAAAAWRMSAAASVCYCHDVAQR